MVLTGGVWHRLASSSLLPAGVGHDGEPGAGDLSQSWAEHLSSRWKRRLQVLGQGHTCDGSLCPDTSPGASADALSFLQAGAGPGGETGAAPSWGGQPWGVLTCR